MVFGSFNPHRPSAMMSDINVTPMVDVMLVLLVIFILAAPMFTNAVQLELPQTDGTGAAEAVQPAVHLTIDAAGKVYWNNIEQDEAALLRQLDAAAKQAQPPELQVRADRATRYEAVAKLMAAAQARGLNQLSFVTEPTTEAAHGQR